MESYSGFYPSRPYWAGSKVDFSVPRVEGWFHDQMSEIVYATSIPDRLSLKISRDGKILIRLNELEPPEGGEIIQPVGVLVKLWGTYLDYLNCFYLLLDSAVTEIDNFALFNLHEITTRDAFRETFDGDRSMGMAIRYTSHLDYILVYQTADTVIWTYLPVALYSPYEIPGLLEGIKWI